MGRSRAAITRKKRRTIGAFRAHAMGESFDCHHSTDVSGNLSLGMVPEERLEYLGEEGGTSSENIVVAVRIRPLSAAEVAEGKRSCCDVLSRNTLVIRKGADPSAYLRSQKVNLTTNKCMPESVTHAMFGFELMWVLVTRYSRSFGSERLKP